MYAAIRNMRKMMELAIQVNHRRFFWNSPR